MSPPQNVRPTHTERGLKPTHNSRCPWGTLYATHTHMYSSAIRTNKQHKIIHRIELIAAFLFLQVFGVSRAHVTTTAVQTELCNRNFVFVNLWCLLALTLIAKRIQPVRSLICSETTLSNNRAVCPSEFAVCLTNFTGSLLLPR